MAANFIDHILPIGEMLSYPFRLQQLGYLMLLRAMYYYTYLLSYI